MAKITAKKVLYNVKQKYVEATGDTSKITYGNIDNKVGDACVKLASGTIPSQRVLDIVSVLVEVS